jgi:hypothetical protein
MIGHPLTDRGYREGGQIAAAAQRASWSRLWELLLAPDEGVDTQCRHDEPPALDRAA